MKANTTPANTRPQGWHPADIVAALRKQGWSLRRLSVHLGYSPTSLAKTLRVPWPKGERLIAAVLETPPQAVWPDRYGADGRPNRTPGPRPIPAFNDRAKARGRNSKPGAGD